MDAGDKYSGWQKYHTEGAMTAVITNTAEVNDFLLLVGRVGRQNLFRMCVRQERQQLYSNYGVSASREISMSSPCFSSCVQNTLWACSLCSTHTEEGEVCLH